MPPYFIFQSIESSNFSMAALFHQNFFFFFFNISLSINHFNHPLSGIFISFALFSPLVSQFLHVKFIYESEQ